MILDCNAVCTDVDGAATPNVSFDVDDDFNMLLLGVLVDETVIGTLSFETKGLNVSSGLTTGGGLAFVEEGTEDDVDGWLVGRLNWPEIGLTVVAAGLGFAWSNGLSLSLSNCPDDSADAVAEVPRSAVESFSAFPKVALGLNCIVVILLGCAD